MRKQLPTFDSPRLQTRKEIVDVYEGKCASRITTSDLRIIQSVPLGDRD